MKEVLDIEKQQSATYHRDVSPGLNASSSIISGSRKMTGRKPLAANGGGRKITNVRSGSNRRSNIVNRSSSLVHNTIDVNLKDDASDNISDITYRSRSCFKRDCCVQKEKIMNKLQNKNKKKASKVRESSIIGGGGGAILASDRQFDHSNPLL